MSTSSFSTMEDFEIKFYAHLGLLSVKFAKLDYNIAKILRKLIDSDEESIAITLTDKNNLSQNLDLLHQINRIRSFNELVISDLIIKVNTVKKDRNLFIHGIWGYPFEDSNETSIICDEKKFPIKKIRIPMVIESVRLGSIIKSINSICRK